MPDDTADWVETPEPVVIGEVGFGSGPFGTTPFGGVIGPWTEVVWTERTTVPVILTPADIPNLDFSKITTGIVPLAQLPDLDFSKITTGVVPLVQIPNLDFAKITTGIVPLAQIPNLDFSKITTGVVPIAQIPTGSTGSTVSLGSHTHAGGLAIVRAKLGIAQVYTSNATFADVPSMGLAVAASSEYDIDCYIYYNGGQTGDIKLQWNGPAGATILGPATGPAASTASATAPSQDSTHTFDTFAVGKAFGCAAVGVTSCIRMSFTVVTGITSGTVQLQGAQNTSDATSTTIIVGSLIEAFKVA